jgi:L-fuculose-phosphate aldolase
MGQQAIGMIVVAGDAEAVKAAVDAGAAAAKSTGGHVRIDVIQRPDQGIRSVPVASAETVETQGPGGRESNLEQAALAFGNPNTVAGSTAPSAAADPELERLMNSPETRAIKEEICTVGRKLWQRGYVDGNGGNISCRIGDNAVVCTPTMLSKADVTPNDLCLVDLEGNQIAGSLPRTSEILLHLEIYKSVPQAKAVIHCHPPHATAYAITGTVPPTGVIPEFDVFVGSIALARYETPGTREFAETVLPFVRSHNTILLGNHGIVCWADTPNHAEWRAENLETYCRTLLISSQLGVPYRKIPPEKQQDLLEIKKRLGLPDPRF